MKINVAASVVVISLSCLVALFHSSDGIVCYRCHSKDYDNEKCEKISDDQWIYDYGTKADYCTKMVFKMKPGPDVREERLLIRRALADSKYSEVYAIMEEHRNRGFEINFFNCSEDRCNGE